MREALNWRYATKSFDPAKKLSNEQLEMLMDAARMAPSSFGLQPFHVSVIQDAGLRAKLRPVSWNQSQITDASHLMVFQVQKTVDAKLVDQYIELVAKTRGQEVAALKEYRDMMAGSLTHRTPEQNHDWAIRQAYISMGFVLLAAAHIGVDACPIEGITPAEYDKLLDMPKYETVAVTALGFRSASDPYAKYTKVRQPKNQFFTMK